MLMRVVRFLSMAALVVAAGVAAGAQQPPEGEVRRSLMHEVVDAKKMTLKAFNDAFLRQGQMPIEMMRAALTRQPLTRDHVAQWKYYGTVVPRP
jgi:hypothetical protein